MKIQPNKKFFALTGADLVQALRLSESQLDFVISGDIKYSMGQGASNDD